MKKTYLLTIAALLAAGPAVAGTLTVEEMPAIEDPVCAVPFTGDVSLGYETDYIFRGVKYGEHAPWASAGINFGLTDSLSVDTGVWYINPTEKDYDNDFDDELDVYAFVNFELGRFTASLGGTWFYFPELGGSTGEVSLGLSEDLGFAEAGFFVAYDVDDDGGLYYEGRLLRSVALTECLDLNLGCGVGYGDDYFGISGFSHAYARAGLGYHLTEAATFNLYVGGNFPLDELDDQEDDTVHGGASISVSF